MRLSPNIIYILLIFSPFSNRLCSSDLPPIPITLQDSTQQPSVETEYTLYQIQRLKIENKLLNLHSNAHLKQFEAEISTLMDETQKYVNQQQYGIANLLLLEIEELLEETAPDSDQPLNYFDRTEISTLSPEQSRRWQAEFISGIDFWNQKFEMNVANADTTLLEGSTNPYVGIQLGYESGPHFQVNLLVKGGRDYQFAANELVLSKEIQQVFSFEVKNLTDWTRYREEGGLSYLQNNLYSKIQYKPGSTFRLYLSEEFRMRKYRDEQSFYADYLQNQVRMLLDSYLFNAFQISAGTRWYRRNHPHYLDQDYHKLGFDVSGYLNLIPRLQLQLNNDLVFKEFINPLPDSLSHANYLQNYLQANLKYYLLNPFHLEINFFSSLVKYETSQSYLRDYLETETEISLNYAFNLTNLLKIGYVYDQNIHQANHAEGDIPGNAEDFYSHGVIGGIDYFFGANFLLNVTDMFRFRFYPHAQELQYFSLYSDRNIHSLFLILSWEISSRSQLSLIANFDDDRDRKHENGDSRNTMFSIEFTRKF